jgi:hypothetical protein
MSRGVAAIPATQTVVWEHLRMSSQDDPEERIRQLEQQSANDGAVELGGSQSSGGVNPTTPLPPPVYDTQQLPPPPTYGSPYQGDPYQPPFGTQYTPMPKKGGVPIGLIFGLIAVVVLIFVGGIGAIVWNVMSKTESITMPRITNEPGGGTVGVPAGPTINIPTVLPTMPSLPGDSPKEGTPGGQLSVAGIDKNEEIACNDANVTVSGVNNTVKLTGHCLSVTVSGVNNRVTVESSDTIGASGFDNQVVFLSGDPEIDSTGSNTVQRG